VLFLVCCVALTADVLVPEIWGNGKTKDYPLWFWAGQQVLSGGNLYPHIPFEYIYPPLPAVLLAVPAWFGKIPLYVCLSLLNAAAWWMVAQFSNAMTGSGKIPGPWLFALPGFVTVTFVFDMFDLGQPNLMLLAIMLYGFWLLQHARPWMAGSLFALATALGLQHAPDLVCPQGAAADDVAPQGRYAVVHATPYYRYKRWTDDGWRRLVRELAARGLSVVATQGPDPAERAYLDALWSGDPSVIRTRGALEWSTLAALLKGAAVYVGPDTSVTHLAAASGCPTVAIYGPTSPRLIGPWPVGGLAEPWNPAGTIQHHGNVWVVQNPQPCLPCEKLGCEGHLDSYSRCLDELSARTVLSAVDQALGR